MRPIDADAALKALRRCQTYLYDARDPELKIELSSAEAAINNLSTIQPEKAQLSKEGTTKGTTSDLISRQQTLDALIGAVKKVGILDADDIKAVFDMLPTIQPIATDTNVGNNSEIPNSSDAVSRQAAIDALDFEIVHMTAYCDGKNVGNPLAQYNKGLEDGKKAIEALPTAQPEPKEGHWKKDETDDCPPVFRRFRICSVCGAIETSETNYCPNCGAKMKGEPNERTD